MTETERAVMEGRRNAASDEYFGARPQIDTMDRRRVFEAGFDRALRVNVGTAKERFDECLGWQEPDPLERLRFFCSLAMTGQDWLDVEAFFDALKTPNVEVTGAARLYRAASVWTAELGGNYCLKK